MKRKVYIISLCLLGVLIDFYSTARVQSLTLVLGNEKEEVVHSKNEEGEEIEEEYSCLEHYTIQNVDNEPKESFRVHRI